MAGTIADRRHTFDKIVDFRTFFDSLQSTYKFSRQERSHLSRIGYSVDRQISISAEKDSVY